MAEEFLFSSQQVPAAGWKLLPVPSDPGATFLGFVRRGESCPPWIAVLWDAAAAHRSVPFGAENRDSRAASSFVLAEQ